MSGFTKILIVMNNDHGPDPLASIAGGATDTPETPGTIGLRICIPAGPVLAVAFPPSNWFGSVALRALLERVLAQAGLLNAKAQWSGEFNASIYIFQVSDTRLAAEFLQRELKPLGLRKWAHLACVPTGETQWRTIYPLPEPADFAQFVTTEALANAGKQAAQIFAAIARSLVSRKDEP